MQSLDNSLAARVELDPKPAEIKKSRLAAAGAAALRCKLPLVGSAIVGITVLTFGGTALAVPTPVGLGTATNDAVVAGSGATNTGTTNITGDVATSPTPALVGFGGCPAAGCVNFAAGSTTHAPPDPLAASARADENTAFLDASQRVATPIANPDLVGLTLPAGVYSFGAAATNLSGSLTLDAQGNPNSTWIFQASSSLITSSGSTIGFINNGGATAAQLSCNVFWTAVSLATLNSGSNFVGTVMAQAGVHVTAGVTVNGRLMSGPAGDVTLISDTIIRPNCAVIPAGKGGGGSGGGTTGGGTTGGGTVATPAGTGSGASGTGGGTGSTGGGTVATPASSVTAAPGSVGLAG